MRLRIDDPRTAGVMLALLAACAGPAGAQQPAKAPEPRVTLSLRNVPLRDALAQLYPGEEWYVSVDPCLPDLPITVSLREFPRSRALAFVAKAAGGGFTAQEEGNQVLVRRSVAARQNGDGSINTGVGFQTSQLNGFSTGPGGTAVPNFSGQSLHTVRRVQPGVPTYLGGINHATGSASRNGVPGLGIGSRMQSGSRGTGGTFVTVTVIPEPETDRPRRSRNDAK